MAILGLNHFTVLTHDLQACKAFYIDLLGLKEGYRPPFTFPGAWLYSGDTAVLHVIAGRALPADPRGTLDHVAFTGRDLVGTASTLTRAGVAYDLRKSPDGTQWQMFCFDPSGARVEIDFDATEPAPAI